MLHRLTLLIGLGTAAAAPAAVPEFQPLDTIRHAALGALAPGAQDEAALDPAQRLPRGAAPLAARPNGAASVEVSCAAPAWRLFVPVSVRRSQSVLVLTRNLGPGEAVGAGDFTVQARDATRLVSGVIADPAQAVGRVARRPLLAGSVLSSADVASAVRIRNGDSVDLVSRSGGIEVRVAGRALGSAGENERLNVENLSSRKIVQGVVDASGAVLVNR